MAGSGTPREPEIARSVQWRARLEGMGTLVEGFSAQLMEEIRLLREEVEQHAGTETEEGDHDDPRR